MLGQELAARVGEQQLTWIEPVQRCRSQQRDRRRLGEIPVLRTAERPERASRRYVVEAEDLFHAAVAVGGDDEDTSRQVADARARREANHEIVMELALCPVLEELERAVRATHVVEERAEDEGCGKSVDARGHT